MQKNGRGKTSIIFLLGALITVSPFSIDMYLPAFSQIAKDFGTTPAKISLSITSYFIGLAIGQLIYGPLLDRYGRKKPLYAGLFLYVLASVGCMQSTSADLLVGFRFIQAIGGCVAIVAAFTMVRDFFPVEESAKVFSLLMLILGASPLLAPTAGGFITTWLGWHWIFIILSVIVILISLATFFFLPPGPSPDHSISLKPGKMIKTFSVIIRNRQFLTYTLAGAFSFCAMFVYVAGSPVIFMEVFHATPQTYGFIFAAMSLGFIGSNQVNILLLRRFSGEQIFYAALAIQLIISLLFLAGAYFHWYGFAGTFTMLFLTLSCLGFTYPNASALALAPFTKNIGSASALIGSLQIGIAGLASAGVGIFNASSSEPVALLLAVSVGVAFLVLVAGRKQIHRHADFVQ